MNDKITYTEKSQEQIDIPLYCRPWWLDLVCGKDGWDVVVVQKGDKLVAALPYVMHKKFGLKVISSPRFTQHLGIWIAPSTAKTAKRLKTEKDIVVELIKKLPKHNVFFQCFSSNFTNWLPLYWLGFEQTSKITYRITDLSDIEAVWANTNANIKTDVRKAKKTLEITSNRSFEEFYALLVQTFQRQGKPCPFDFSSLQRVVDGTISRNAGRLFFAVDEEDKIHAAVFIIWDKKCGYYLMSGANPDLRNSGAGSLCLWEAISFCSTVTEAFDFEGSMVEGIERFFRGFGGEQVTYYRLRWFSNSLLSLAYSYKSRKSQKI